MVQPKRVAAPKATRPPRTLSVVRDPELAEQVDWSSWYLTDEDDMAQPLVQSVACDLFKEVAEVRAAELGMREAFVALDTFFAWVEGEPLVRVSPDVYVLAKHPGLPLPDSFQTWLPGHVPPLLAVEVVSGRWKKDYDASEKYAQLGAGELVIFDPRPAEQPAQARPAERVPLQVYRRTVDGLFVRRYVGEGPAFIEALQAWAVVSRLDGSPVLRLAYDATGHELVPSISEQRDEAARQRDEAARQRDEAARQRDEAARQRDEAARQRDAERARNLALEARLAALEAATNAERK